jgi:hypothetical protein
MLNGYQKIYLRNLELKYTHINIKETKNQSPCSAKFTTSSNFNRQFVTAFLGEPSGKAEWPQGKKI